MMKCLIRARGSHGRYCGAKSSFKIQNHHRLCFVPELGSPYSNKSRCSPRLAAVVLNIEIYCNMELPSNE